MKKNLFLIVMAVLSVAGCKKNSNTSKAAFTTTKSNYYFGESIQINNASDNGTYNWNFGDGATSTDVSPTHAYNRPGNFIIRLVVNGSGKASKTVKIYNGSSSYEIDNLGTRVLPLVSFSQDGLNNIIDFTNDGTISANGGKSDTVFTYAKFIFIGGIFIGGKFVDDTLFTQVHPTTLIPFAHNKLIFADTTKYITSSSSNVSSHTLSARQFFNLKTRTTSTLKRK